MDRSMTMHAETETKFEGNETHTRLHEEKPHAGSGYASTPNIDVYIEKPSVETVAGFAKQIQRNAGTARPVLVANYKIMPPIAHVETAVVQIHRVQLLSIFEYSNPDGLTGVCD
jgi:hypothetical protein